MNNATFDQCYSSISPDGKVTLTPWFQGVLDREFSRGFAMDAADAEPEDPYVLDEQYEYLNAGYANLRDKLRGDFIKESLDLETHARETQARGDNDTRALRAATANESLNDGYKKQRGFDARYCSTALLLLCLFAPMLRAQGPVPVPIYGGFATHPSLGGSCPFAPPNTGTPTAYLTSAGAIITCAIVPGTLSGFWQLANRPFQISLPPAAAVSMNGTDQTLFSVPVPPLPAGACYNLAFATGALANGTLNVKVDGTIVNTPITGATLSNLSVSNVNYCNQIGSQTSQFFGTYWINADAESFWTQNISPAASVNWTAGHVISLTGNQASGSIAPLSFTIVEGL